MAYTVNKLPFPPVSLLKLPGTLDPSFEESERKAHAAAWEPLEQYGIQPCGDGVQVYAQPQTIDQVERLAQALMLVAARLPRGRKKC